MATKHYSIDELISNESFIKWVVDPKSDLDAYWDRYLHNNPDLSEQVSEAADMIKSVNAAKKSPTSEQKIKILENIHKGIESIDVAPAKNTSRKTVTAIAFLLAIALCSYYVLSPNKNSYIATDYNEKQQLQLPDGSQVILNSNSSLTFTDNWETSSKREVWLEGEAYFDIHKEILNEIKFIVHTTDLKVIVLGTQFNVNTHKSATDVVLEEGKIDIRITKADHPITAEVISMLPGQKTSFDPDQKNYLVSKVNTAVYTAWKDGTVVFDGTPLSEFKSMIEHNYGYEVIFDNPKLLSKKLDGKIESPNLETLLNTLETIFDLQIQKKGKRIIIKE